MSLNTLTWDRALTLMIAGLTLYAPLDWTRPSGRVAAQEPPNFEISYLQQRASFRTNLKRRGGSPNGSKEPKPLDGYQKVLYPSKEHRLKAWVYRPPGAKKRLPAIVHFHGGFGLSHGHFHTCKPFQKAGFVVMLPALRAENGNPGTFEMFYSEVEDGIAAIKWLQRQPFVDPNNVYAFGHSAGGVVSSMISLFDDVPIRHSGSSGGIYDTKLFDGIRDRVPFDLASPMERQMRVLVGNVRWMKRPHYAYVGDKDTSVLRGATTAQKELQREGSKQKLLHFKVEKGDHFKSLKPAMDDYIKVIRETMARERGAAK